MTQMGTFCRDGVCKNILDNNHCNHINLCFTAFINHCKGQLQGLSDNNVLSKDLLLRGEVEMKNNMFWFAGAWVIIVMSVCQKRETAVETS